jgi:hypothetical protein
MSLLRPWAGRSKEPDPSRTWLLPYVAADRINLGYANAVARGLESSDRAPFVRSLLDEYGADSPGWRRNDIVKWTLEDFGTLSRRVGDEAGTVLWNEVCSYSKRGASKNIVQGLRSVLQELQVSEDARNFHRVLEDALDACISAHPKTAAEWGELARWIFTLDSGYGPKGDDGEIVSSERFKLVNAALGGALCTSRDELVRLASAIRNTRPHEDPPAKNEVHRALSVAADIHSRIDIPGSDRISDDHNDLRRELLEAAKDWNRRCKQARPEEDWTLYPDYLFDRQRDWLEDQA